jgi:hypothetical protein
MFGNTVHQKVCTFSVNTTPLLNNGRPWDNHLGTERVSDSPCGRNDCNVDTKLEKHSSFIQENAYASSNTCKLTHTYGAYPICIV